MCLYMVKTLVLRSRLFVATKRSLLALRSFPSLLVLNGERLVLLEFTLVESFPLIVQQLAEFNVGRSFVGFPNLESQNQPHSY